MKRYLISTRKGEKKLPNEYSKEDLISRWEEFFEATHYRLKVIEVSTLFPELRSVYVKYSDLDAFDPDMADYVLQHPNIGIWTGEQAIHKASPPGREGALIHLRLIDLPRDCRVEIRDLRSKHMGKLISIEGLVRKATEVRPKIVDALFQCLRCQAIIKEPQEGMVFKEPLECYEAQGGCGKSSSSTKFKLLTEESIFVDTQKIEIQESPEGLRGGAQPERLVGFMEDDIAGDVSPGDRVILNGSLRSVQKGTVSKSTLFDIHLDVISMEFEEHEYEEVAISEEDEERIKEEAADPNVFKKIVASISPTIYGYDIEKESIALQLFGGVPKELDDGTRIRGDIHILLVGDPGVAKCVSGDSRVTLADGQRVRIKELVDFAIENAEVGTTDDGFYANTDLEVISLGKDGKLTKARANLVWKRTAPSKMLRFRMFSGKELIVTPTHPFFVWKSGIRPKPAKELREGEFIATPRSLDIPGEMQDPSKMEYRKSRSYHATRLNMSSIGAVDFWRLIGLMIGDGHVQIRENGTANAFFANNDRSLLDEVYGLSKKMGMNPSIRKPHAGKNAFEVVISGIEFCTLLSNMGLDRPSPERRMPDLLFRCSHEEIASAISGFFDAEGSVRKGTRMISIPSSSIELLKDIQHLLLRLGIQSRRKRFFNRYMERYYYRLLVSGGEVEKFKEKIPFRSPDKKHRLSEIVSKGLELNTNLDVIPNTAIDLERTRRALRMYQSDYPVPRPTMAHYLSGDRNPSVDAFSRIVNGLELRYQQIESIENRFYQGAISWDEAAAIRGSLHMSQEALAESIGVSQSGVSYLERNCPKSEISMQVAQGFTSLTSEVLSDQNRGDIEKIKKLAESDVFWDMVESIEEIKYEDPYVYDLQVPEHHNFIAEDIIVHNSQLLRYMSTLAPRGIYASGKSSSAAGLCVSPLTHILVDGEDVHIEEFIEERMRFPEEYREGIEREMINGPRVACVNGSGEVIHEEVEAIWRINTPSFLVELETSEKRWLRCTAETRVWSRRSGEEGWRQANELDDGDELLWRGYKGDKEPRWLPIIKIMQYRDDLPRYVYDLTVKNTHAFLGNGFLVHNTAAAVKDDFGEGRWTLEAGALVLADKGVACVDELDKMTDQDRSSMHEAMESQTISVAKAGITATLQCRCSILGAANPKYGRFEEHQYIADQINLPPALMSRFDLIFAMTDKPDAKRDSQITNHILKAHWRGQIRKYSEADLEDMPGVPVSKIMEETQELCPAWSVEFFRKYVAHSKRIYPVFTEEAIKIIHDYYMEIRRGGEDQGSVPITARQLEAFVRISEASARARLSNTVSVEDARRAVRIVEYYLKKIAGQEGQIDIDIIATGTSRSQRDQISVLRKLISEHSEGSKGVSVEALLQAAESEGIEEDKMRRLLKKLSEAGEIYQPHAGYYRLAMEG
jgi:replicative DNA helicase Mcm